MIFFQIGKSVIVLKVRKEEIFMFNDTFSTKSKSHKIIETVLQLCYFFLF